MTKEQAVEYLERCADGYDPLFDEAVKLAVAALQTSGAEEAPLRCKVGDPVYQTDGIRVYESKIKRILFDTDSITFDEQAIGTSVFLTHKEAAAHLRD